MEEWTKCVRSDHWGHYGIGLAFAKNMANKGYSLFLISRSEEKLAMTKENIKAKCPKVGKSRH